MLGSIDDAEDAVQEALARAWRSRATYRPTGPLRAWLYRIATNVCLDQLAGRRRREREIDGGVGPIPDLHLVGRGPSELEPEARYAARESVSLAFLRLLQVLPPRQRAALLLRDVLGWHASEVASLLGVSVPAANSALQRARATLAAAPGAGAIGRPAAGTAAGLLDRYVRAWEAADIPGLVGLLRDDARLAMPPRPPVDGAAAIGAFLWQLFEQGSGRRRLVRTGANGQPAFAAYARRRGAERWSGVAILVLEIDGLADRVARIDAFSDPAPFARFGFVRELDDVAALPR